MQSISEEMGFLIKAKWRIIFSVNVLKEIEPRENLEVSINNKSKVVHLLSK